MIHTLPTDLWPLILKEQDMILWFRQGLHLVCKAMRTILFSDNSQMNKLWLLLFEKYELTVKPIGPACFEFIRWQKNELKLHQIMKRIFEEKKNVFITGGAGVGKSYLLKKMSSLLYGNWGSDRFSICASTGSAAVLVEGSTFHSFVGIGTKTLLDFPLKTILRMMRDECKERWKTIELLIVDEISMVSPDFLETVDVIAKAIREKPNLPFGGVQMVFIGDFYQLAPIPRKEVGLEKKRKSESSDLSTLSKKMAVGTNNPQVVAQSQPSVEKSLSLPRTYCFETKCWSDTIKPENSFVLDYVFRQNDRQFCALLKSIRTGESNESVHKKLYSRVITNFLPHCHDKEEAKNLLFANDEVKPTELHCLNRSADAVNQSHLNKLLANKKIKAYSMDALFCVQAKAKCIEKDFEKLKTELKESCPIPAKYTLCIGAQIMLTANLSVEDGLINGSRGIVVDFRRRSYEGHIFYDPVVEFANGEERIIKQSIWSYGYELVKPKNQVSYVNPPLKSIRFRSGFVKTAFETKKETKAKKKKSKKNDSETEGENEDKDEHEDEDEENKDDDDFNFVLKQLEASFCGIYMVQYPLILAWAISIHKSQGMSMDKAIVNIGQAFACGQGYVALSRLMSLDGLYLYSFHPNNIKTDPKVKQFYADLQQKQKAIETRQKLIASKFK